MRHRTEIFHARLNLPGGTVRSINLDEADGRFLLTAFGGYDGFISDSFDKFDDAWTRVLEIMET